MESFKILKLLRNYPRVFLGTYMNQPALIKIVSEKLDYKSIDSFPSWDNYKLVRSNDNSHLFWVNHNINSQFSVELIINPSKNMISDFSKTNKLTTDTYQTYLEQIEKVKHDDLIYNPKWIHNILDGTEEQELLVDDTRYYKLFHHKDHDGSYYLAFFKNKIDSIRDLTGSDIPMLKEVNANIKSIVGENYHIYFHYLPSYYWLHLHVVNIDKKDHLLTSRCHVLETVISNLEIDSDYYKKVIFRLTN